MKHLASTLAGSLLFLAGCETLEPLPEAGLSAAPAPHYAVPPDVTSTSIQGSYHTVQRGESLWGIARSYGLQVTQVAAMNRISSTTPLRIGQRLLIPLPSRDTGQFLWPIHGRIARGARGVDIAAAPGSVVRASRGGQVAVAARNLSGWGRTVIVDHHDGYLTVYAGMDQLLVPPGANVRQGLPVGQVGHRALHFEIRYGAAPKNALTLLPRN